MIWITSDRSITIQLVSQGTVVSLLFNSDISLFSELQKERKPQTYTGSTKGRTQAKDILLLLKVFSKTDKDTN